MGWSLKRFFLKRFKSTYLWSSWHSSQVDSKQQKNIHLVMLQRMDSPQNSRLEEDLKSLLNSKNSTNWKWQRKNMNPINLYIITFSEWNWIERGLKWVWKFLQGDRKTFSSIRSHRCYAKFIVRFFYARRQEPRQELWIQCFFSLPKSKTEFSLKRNPHQ